MWTQFQVLEVPIGQSRKLDRADTNSQAALQELSYDIDDDNRIRVRIFVIDATIRLGTAVTAPDLAGVTFSDVAGVAFAQRAWHRISYTLSTKSTPRHITWKVDGATVVFQREIQDASHLRGTRSRGVILRNGIFYVGPLPDAGATRYSMDNVLLTVPSP